MFLFYFGVALFFINVGTLLELCLGNRRFKYLKDLPLEETISYPTVSIILAAKDEEDKIEECVTSLLKLDYPQLELIVVNDRSQDGTAQILSKLANQHSALVVETVHTLPNGWLGKTHALVQGFRRSSGEWLLFTDGDVIFERSTLKRALRHAQVSGVDHLPAMPEILPGTFWYNLVVPAFSFYFLQFMKPWLAKNPNKKHFLGVGAFNLVRRETYLAAGTHEAIKMRPDEDIRLGELIKKSGAVQEAIIGNEMVQVQWYSTLGELCRGLEKNTLAGINYRAGLMFLSFGAIFFFHLFPTLCLFFTRGHTQLLFLGILFVQILGFWDLARFYKGKSWRAVAFPMAIAIYLYIMVRATVLTLWRKGIEWRGTFYTLDKLRGKTEFPQNPSSR